MDLACAVRVWSQGHLWGVRASLRWGEASSVLGRGTPGELLGIVSVLRGPSEPEGAIADRGEERAKKWGRNHRRRVRVGGRGELNRYGHPGGMAGRGSSWLDWAENGDRHWHSGKQCSWALLSRMVRFKIMV